MRICGFILDTAKTFILLNPMSYCETFILSHDIKKTRENNNIICCRATGITCFFIYLSQKISFAKKTLVTFIKAKINERYQTQSRMKTFIFFILDENLPREQSQKISLKTFFGRFLLK